MATDKRAIVRYEPYDNEREVKNLGWLLRHASEAQLVEVNGYELSVTGREFKHPQRSWVYMTTFADRSVLNEWVKRPALRHCRFAIDA